MEFLFGIAMIVGVAKVGEMLVEMARSRSNMGATQEVRALYHEVHALREEMAALRTDERERHPLLARTSSETGTATRWYANSSGGNTDITANTVASPVRPRHTDDFVMPRPEAQILPATAAARNGNSGGGAATADVTARVEQLQQEMNRLRDTTTQFDLSFDTAVDRLERRLQEMERQGDATPAQQQVVGRAR